MRIPTCYDTVEELYLDMSILGKILQSQYKDYTELEEIVKSEYVVKYPKPTLEQKRFELSPLVSNDYRVDYTEGELILGDNEALVDLTQEGVVEDFEELSEDVPDDVKVYFRYENGITNDLREQYIKEGLQEFTGDISVIGTVKQSTELELSDEEIEELSQTEETWGSGGLYMDDSTDESEYSDEYIVSLEEDFDGGSGEETDDFDTEGEEDFDVDFDTEEDEDFGIDLTSGEGEELGTDGDEFDTEEDEDDFDVGFNTDSDAEEDEDIGVGFDTGEDEDIGVGFDTGEDEDIGIGFDTEEDEDIGIGFDTEEDEDLDVGVNTEEETEDEYLESDGDYGDEGINVGLNTKEGVYERDVGDGPDDEDLGFTNEVEMDFGNTTIVYQNTEVKVEEPVVQEERPANLREFVRKHPRCSVRDAMQYFSKKEIEKDILMGKVVRKGDILHI